MNAYEEIHQDLVDTIAALIEANRTTPVIVEGERDVRSLQTLGLEGEVIPLNSGVSLFHLAESLARRHAAAIILTDWDRRGGQLARLLRDALEANQVRFDTDFRARLTLLCRKDIKDVEGLAGFVERVGRQVEGGWHGKASKRFYAGRKSAAVQDRRSRRILAKRAPRDE